jgi:hypothetical protein
MDKPASLRNYLLANNNHIKRNPESLIIYIDEGKLSTQLQANLNFNYNYSLKVIITDFAEHPDAIIIPLLAWLRIHQIDLKPDDIEFEADIISHDKIDLEISFPLNECVIVTDDMGMYSAEHLPEPTPDYNEDDPALFKELFNDETDLTNVATDNG